MSVARELGGQGKERVMRVTRVGVLGWLASVTWRLVSGLMVSGDARWRE
jgi:hypothetical protein